MIRAGRHRDSLAAARRNLPILIADDNHPAVVLDRQHAYTATTSTDST